MKHLYRSVFSGALLTAMIAAPCLGLAQPAQPPSAAEAQAALSASTKFTKKQLDQMLAPIALYPDQLLTQLLMAATFPQQLVDAQNWLQDGKNAALKGDDLADALGQLPWDPSVKSLVAFQQVVAMLTDHLGWTEALGTAFANQQIETMARIQFLRDRAVAAGQLKSSPQLTVQNDGGDIVIEPVDPGMVYVPVYNPAQVYGDWPDNDAPPVYLPPPPDFYTGAVGAGIGFSVGFGVVRPLWGWGRPDWHEHRVVVDQKRFSTITPPSNRGPVTIQQGGTWHRTEPVIFVPLNQRPHPQPQNSPPPPGTVRPGAVAQPLIHPGPAQSTTPTPPPHLGEAPHPAPATATTPVPPHQGETPHPPPGITTTTPAPLHQGETPRPPPGVTTTTPAPLHQGEAPHPPPGTATTTPAPLHQGEAPHPPPATTTTTPAPLHQGATPHPAPPATITTPAPVTTQQPPPPVPHPPPPPPVTTQQPPPAPHPPPPPAAAQQPPPVPHPPPPPPQAQQPPPVPHPAPQPAQQQPPKKPPPKPGEEQAPPQQSK